MRPEYSTAAAEREYKKLVFNPEVFAAEVTALSRPPPEQHERPSTPMAESTPSIDELQERKLSLFNFIYSDYHNRKPVGKLFIVIYTPIATENS